MTEALLSKLIPFVLTRPTRASIGFWSSLSPNVQNVLDPVVSPLVEIVPLQPEDSFPQTDAVVFSSANGAQHGPPGDGRPAFCVGEATTKAASNRGWSAVQTGQTADDVVRKLSDSDARPSLLHLSGQHTRGDLVGRLSDAGFRVHHAIVYDQVLQPLSSEAINHMKAAEKSLVPLFSPRTAAHFSRQDVRPESTHLIVMSRSVALALENLPFASVTIAEQPTAHAMRDATQTWLKSHASG